MLRPSLCPAETDSVSSHSSLEDIGVVAAVGLNIFFVLDLLEFNISDVLTYNTYLGKAL